MFKKITDYKNLNSIIGLLIITFLILFNLYNKKKQVEIEKYEGKSIAYTKQIIRGEDLNSIKFYFYYKEKLFYSQQILKDEEKHRSDILNDYFLVTFDTNNLDKNYIHLDKKIKPDSVTLVKAGFTYKKYYEHDIATNTYIERYKWR
ncbi:conserved hypothetical protein [Flavobacterium sp. 9AF]|uniref:hypothetical protein n=1 Tax=Flavobacterium sp. 9AF TaxID=2653142 RepID=UPI0012F46A10|nr:hypothetical protein [Flavobacterium sp. 9AF]VXB78512.1 conserved hypothetical protein [Flavobacterium sp. 9AF]